MLARVIPVVALGASLAVPFSLSAQALPPLDEYRIRVFGNADGLPSSDVRGVVQTRDHYLIVATALGLVRFDGHTFEPIPTPGLGLPHWMHRDRQDRIWIRSYGNRVGVLRGDTFRLLPDQPGYPSDDNNVSAADLVRGMWLTRDGSIWFGGRRGMLRAAVAELDSFARFTVADGLPNDTVMGVFDIADDRVVVTRSGLATIREDPARSSGLGFEPFGPPCRVVADPAVVAGRIRLTCDAGQGYYLLDYADGRFTGPDPEAAAASWPPVEVSTRLEFEAPGSPFLSPSDPGSATPDQEPYFGNTVRLIGLSAKSLGIPLSDEPLVGAIFDAANGTRWRTVYNADEPPHFLFRERAGVLQWIRLRRDHDFRGIPGLFEDHEGNLWVSTDRGLLELTERAAFALTTREGLADGFTTAILQTRDSALWIGTWGGGLQRFAGGRLAATYTTADGLPDLRVRSLYESRDGALWIGTYNGLAVMRDGRIIARYFSHDEVRAFAEADGRFLIATQNELLSLPPGSLDIARANSLMSGRFWALHAASDRTLWIGTEEGLFRLDDGRIGAVGEADGLNPAFVPMIHEDPDGVLWFSTYTAGLVRYRDGRFTWMTARDGLPADGIWAMVEDGRGGVWLSSNNGIARFDKAGLECVPQCTRTGRAARPPQGPRVHGSGGTAQPGIEPGLAGGRATTRRPARLQQPRGRRRHRPGPGQATTAPVLGTAIRLGQWRIRRPARHGQATPCVGRSETCAVRLHSARVHNAGPEPLPLSSGRLR